MARDAYVISLTNSARGRYASFVLNFSGFNPQMIVPVDLSTSQSYMQTKHIESHPKKISNFLTHVNLWKHALSNKSSYTYIFEDDIELPIINTQKLHRELDAIEMIRPRIIHLGGCAEHIGPLVRASWIRCAALCSHAYAVRSDEAQELLEKMLEAAKRQNSSYYKTSWDVVMRGYYVHIEKNKKEWPVCAKPYIYVQNRSRFKSQLDR